MSAEIGNAALEEALGKSVPKTFRIGTHRMCSPEATLVRFRPMMGALGITRIGLCTGLDSIGIPVGFAVRPNSRSVSVSQGKGCTNAQALASALMEAVELAHAESLDLATRIATRAELAHDTSIVAPLAANCSPPPENTLIRWIPGWDLLRHSSCWLPAAVVDADFRLPRPEADRPFLGCTNGLGSGNHMLEALIAAICEVVERDALAVWHAHSLAWRAQTRLDLATVNDPECRHILDRMGAAGMAVAAWDITTDIKIPTFLAILTQHRSDHGPPLREFRGGGCHPSPEIALSRALTEAAQTRLTRIAGARDDMEEEAPLSQDVAIARMLLDLLGHGEGRHIGTVTGRDGDDLGDDLRSLLDSLVAAGVTRVVAANLTSPTFKIPVVRVIIPELEVPPDHPLYSPGPRALRAMGYR